MADISRPKDLVLAVTYQCNSRCRMCNIWQMDNLSVLSLEEYKKLPKSLKEINITGGEPFLREDIVDLIKLIVRRNPKARIIISSNGFATDLIKKKMVELIKIKPDIGVGISIDGIGEVHEQVRGVPNGFSKVVETIKMLKNELNINNLRIAFTAGDYNIIEMEAVYKLANQLGVEFTVAAIHNSDIYFSTDNNKITKIYEFKKQFSKLIKSELKSFNLKRWARAYFTYGLYKFVSEGKRILPNYSGTDNVFIDPLGNIYPSDVSAHQMGNIKDFESYDELTQTKKAQKAVKAEQFAQNWMICTSRSAIKRHPFKVLFWVIKTKLFGANYDK